MKRPTPEADDAEEGSPSPVAAASPGPESDADASSPSPVGKKSKKTQKKVKKKGEEATVYSWEERVRLEPGWVTAQEEDPWIGERIREAYGKYWLCRPASTAVAPMMGMSYVASLAWQHPTRGLQGAVRRQVLHDRAA
jgi:hypothetical protein